MLRNIVCFDTFNEMINSNEVRSGMVIITLGKNSIADGGSSIYRVVDSGNTYDRKSIISQSNRSIRFIEVFLNKNNISSEIVSNVEDSKQSVINLLLPMLPR